MEFDPIDFKLNIKFVPDKLWQYKTDFKFFINNKQIEKLNEIKTEESVILFTVVKKDGEEIYNGEAKLANMKITEIKNEKSICSISLVFNSILKDHFLCEYLADGYFVILEKPQLDLGLS